MKDYLYVRYRYNLLVRLMFLLTSLTSLYCLFMVENIFTKFIYIFICIVILIGSIYMINRWYINIVKQILYCDINLKAFRQFVYVNASSKIYENQLQSRVASIIYNYLIGEFDLAIEKINELMNNYNLEQAQKNDLLNYQIKSKILSGKYVNKQEFKEDISKLSLDNTLETASIINSYEAMYDILVDQQINDYFEELKSDFKLKKIEYIFFKAKNNILKNNIIETKKLFDTLSKENSELFVVKKARRYLEENKNDY